VYHRPVKALSGGMIRATLHLKIRAGRELEFRRAWTDVATEVSRLPGNLRQSLTNSERDPSTFTITSDWVDEDSFRAFERSAEQDALTAKLRALRESASMTVDDLVAHIDGELATWPA
jgi:heme-degrading monooxygenase HmoA